MEASEQRKEDPFGPELVHAVRVTAWAGIAVAVLFVLSLLIANPGDIPGTDEPGKVVAEYYSENRGAILTSAALNGLAWTGVFLVFLVGLQTIVRERDAVAELWATVGLIAGVAEAVIIGVFVILLSTAAFRALDGAVSQSLHDGVLLSNAVSGYATAVCLVGFTVAFTRGDEFPLWLAPLGIATAGSHLLSAFSLSSTGVFSPSGFFGYVSPALFVAWMVSVSVSLLRAVTPEGERPRLRLPSAQRPDRPRPRRPAPEDVPEPEFFVPRTHEEPPVDDDS